MILTPLLGTHPSEVRPKSLHGAAVHPEEVIDSQTAVRTSELLSKAHKLPSWDAVSSKVLYQELCGIFLSSDLLNQNCALSTPFLNPQKASVEMPDSSHPRSLAYADGS